jgi:hypothetical protein
MTQCVFGRDDYMRCEVDRESHRLLCMSNVLHEIVTFYQKRGYTSPI